uniref:LOW QUALITY PROTEIN: serine/threonine-protein kinase ULK4-like n=1 Tax=Styela clava TaxID=7725 RepID=UPI00193A45B3|nr:LOW QUALITY PROTEIN: serine/threonine-protein kinase ULK4-like [Styela clava]
MENFILYEEIGKGSHSVVYKGRRKGTINFLAILCIEKCKRGAITNWVRLTHELEHEHIVKFYEWYETSNHLWMVVELCTGGTLDKVLSLDNCLPEDIVREFGKDIASALHHLHQIGVLFANLCPKKILLDGPGILKLTNFGLARLEGENLAEVYEQATAQHRDMRGTMKSDLMGDIKYIAPEVLKEESPSISSDLWSLGILLYQMHAGTTPFKGRSLAELLQNLNTGKFDPTDVMRKKIFAKDELPSTIRNEKPSNDLVDLISGLLRKNQHDRYTWDDVIKHPFWKGSLDHFSSVDKSTDENTLTISDTNAAGDFLSASNTLLTKSVDQTPRESQIFNSSGDDGTQRVSTAPRRVDALDSTFTLSSRPHTALICDPDTGPGREPSPNKSTLAMGTTFTLEGRGLFPGRSSSGDVSPSSSQQEGNLERNVKKSLKKKLDVRQNSQSSEIIALEDVKDLIYHSSDMEISVIQDNSQISKVDPLNWDAKSLPFRPLPSVDSVTPDDLYNHMKEVIQVLSQSQSSVKVKSNVVVYLAHLCTRTSAIANFTVNSQLLHILANLARQSTQPQPDLGFKAARAIGLASCCATELEYGSRITEVFSALADSIRENFRNQRVKLALLPALGQLLYLVAEQEEGNLANTAEEDKKGNWAVPSSAYMLINRCLREGEDPVVQHIACKTIECVMSKTGSHRKRFVSSSQQQGQGGEVIGTLLWTIANRAPSDALKQSAMAALCRLNCISGNGICIQGVIDKIGLADVLTTLSKSIRCVNPSSQSNRLAASKEILPSLMKFLDSPSTVVRAKVFLAVLMLMRRSPETLLAACTNRLVMYIERDNRKATSSIMAPGSMMESRMYPNDPNLTQTLPPNSEYMQSALNLLVRHILSQCPPIMAACVSLLEETSGRKHPSASHVKQLKICLPTCTIIMHTVTSQVFRQQMVTSDFISELGCLLAHATKFLQQQSKSTGIGAALGEDISQQFIDSVLSIVESLSQHLLIITQHEEATMQSLIPRLIVLLGVYNQDGKAVCIKLLDDVLGTLLHHRTISREEEEWEEKKKERESLSSRSSSRSARKRRDLPDEHGLCDLIITSLIPEYQPIFLGHDPLPAYGARLLSTLLEYWPKLISAVYECGLLPIILQVYSEQMSCVLGSCAQGIVSLLIHVLYTKDITIANELYDNGLIDHVNSHLVEVSCQYMEAQEMEDSNNISIATEGLTNLFLLLKEMLTLVTGEVKKALQAKAAPESERASATENAERMLVINKPLTELQGICIQLLCDDQELADLALTNFSMLVQLYGGDHPDTMADENMECLAEALSKAQPKQQKILLKIIKRVVSLNEYHADNVYGEEGKNDGNLLAALRHLAGDAERRADSVITQLANEILATVEGRQGRAD